MTRTDAAILLGLLNAYSGINPVSILLVEAYLAAARDEHLPSRSNGRVPVGAPVLVAAALVGEAAALIADARAGPPRAPVVIPSYRR